jgi:serine/threonine protein kinase
MNKMKRKHEEVDNKVETRYKKLKVIGSGTYGVVYLAKDTNTGEEIALKKCRPFLMENGFPSSTLREIAVLKKLLHPNIIKYYSLLITRLLNIVPSEKSIGLAFELMPCNLRDYLSTHKHLTESKKKRLFQGIVKAVAFIHSQGIFHRDLKPGNILMTEEGMPKIADFGLSKSFQLPVGKYTHEVGSLYYRSPEILLGAEEYSTALDTWSLGCIFYEIFTGKILFQSDSEIDQLYQIFQVLGTVDEERWPGVTKLKYYKDTFPKWNPIELITICGGLSKKGVDLLEKMLVYNPAERISANDILMHPFLKKTSI